MKRIRRIAPRAPQIAPRQTHKHARQPRPRPFSLNRFEYFRNEHVFGQLFLYTTLSRCVTLTGRRIFSLLRYFVTSLLLLPTHHKAPPKSTTGRITLQYAGATPPIARNTTTYPINTS